MSTQRTNPYDALVRRLEMTLSRQRLAIADTELQVEAARKMQAEQAVAMNAQVDAFKTAGSKR